MTAHPTPAQLQGYADRRLSAPDLLRVDRHVAGCTECAAGLARLAKPDAAAGLLRRARRSGPHLSYEELEVVVDASSALSVLAQSHLDGCARCQRELHEMRGYAPSLSARVERQEAAPSLRSRLVAWFGGSRALGAATAMLALAIAVSVVWQGGLVDRLDDSSIRSAHVSPDTSVRSHDVYDESVLDELAALSPDADAAYRRQDVASVAKILQPLADGGDARAQAALGLLYAEGRGVDPNPAEAERWLSLAADRNASAQHNLTVLRQRMPAKPTR